MLLERMRLRPDEFVMSNPKWTWVRALVRAPSTYNLPVMDGPYITAEEAAVIREAFIAIDAEEFTQRVAAEIMREPHDKLSGTSLGLAPLKQEGAHVPYIPQPKLRLMAP